MKTAVAQCALRRYIGFIACNTTSYATIQLSGDCFIIFTIAIFDTGRDAIRRRIRCCIRCLNIRSIISEFENFYLIFFLRVPWKKNCIIDL